ncbi:AAA family ATPase [Chamaesiphon minutus]|uniref:AAA+ family ATPase n=1 Tax=Chamaesiphon minutus (strain ATCC 27169 / PCC 6605) TaxID=1173020 RepID=K9ULD4_CHAP6|nr:AAA family ATPase [Chamaesiphon minutus]AFY95468.1 AAA+ family ATPase [Chamaesiphon minutus PCC 6605]
MFNSLDPIWLFLGGLVIRYGGDLLKIIIEFGLQRLACQITIAETNPIYSAICWELERTGKVYDFSELIYTATPLVPPAVESPTLKTRLQPRSGWIGVGYQGAYIGIRRHDFKVTDLQNTQLLTLATLRWWQPQMLTWLTKIETNYNLEAPLIVRLIGGTISIVRTQTKRRIETLAIDAQTETELFSDLDRFLQSRDLYRQRGIPWRRGYLLYGPPGTGKSSLIQAIASHYDRQLVSLSLTDMDDSALLRAWSEITATSLVALEDIDSVFSGRKPLGELSFSALLNTLDGAGAVEGSITILTTNHRSQLDPALIRPGRCDREFELGYLTPESCAKMFGCFFPDSPLVANITAQLGSYRVSPAAWQNYLQSQDSAELAAKNCDFAELQVAD